MYNKLVTKVIKINTSGFVLKTKYDTDKSMIYYILEQSKETILEFNKGTAKVL